MGTVYRYITGCAPCGVLGVNAACTHLLQALNAARAEASSSTAAARRADAECDRMAADVEAADAARDSTQAALADAQADQVPSLTTMQVEAVLAAGDSSHRRRMTWQVGFQCTTA